MVNSEITPYMRDRQWQSALQMEVTAARRFHDDWDGFATEHAMPAKVQQCTQTAKYFTGGLCSIERKKISLKGRAAEVAERQLQSSQQLLATMSRTGSRPSTALEATFYSHSHRLGRIARDNCMYYTCSARYGQRFPLEQFGVAEHGVRTSRTKLPPC